MKAIRNRYLDLLGSIYIYNEHRGYTAFRLFSRGGSRANAGR
jgi:hypothetical protein